MNNDTTVTSDTSDSEDVVTGDTTLHVTDGTESNRGSKPYNNEIIEDRRDRVSQFDLAVVKLGSLATMEH